MPAPYCSGPAISAGNAPLLRLWQAGQRLIWASTWCRGFSKTMSMRVRRSWSWQGVWRRSWPQHAQALTGEHSTVSMVRVLWQRPWCSPWPWVLRPGRVAVSSSFSVCDGGRLELRLFLGVCFSMNTAISSSNSASRAWNKTLLSRPTLPAAHRRSSSPVRASNSWRRLALLRLAILKGAGVGLAAIPVNETTASNNGWILDCQSLIRRFFVVSGTDSQESNSHWRVLPLGRARRP